MHMWCVRREQAGVRRAAAATPQLPLSSLLACGASHDCSDPRACRQGVKALEESDQALPLPLWGL